MSGGAMAARLTYTAIFERDESGAWLARVAELQGCHTYGRSLAQARRRLREALGLWVERPERVTLVESVRLSRELREAVHSTAAARDRARRAGEAAQVALARAARTLTVRHGLSARDAGELLGLSHQRVAQLTGRSRSSNGRRMSP